MSLSVLSDNRELKSAKSRAIIQPLSGEYILSERDAGQANAAPESVEAAFTLDI